MPNRDGTGPLGQGPMTGLRLGSCSTVEFERPLVNSEFEQIYSEIIRQDLRNLNSNGETAPLGMNFKDFE